eukprot:gene39076-51421_t
MELSNQQTLPVSQQIAWEALNDITILQAAIPGCESITPTEPDQYEVVVMAAIGPVKAKFKGKLKLADIIINVTSGGPGGATDSVTSFIFREYRDRSNVGYGTLLALVYLILIVIFITVLLKVLNKAYQRNQSTRRLVAIVGRILVYVGLLLWALICLFPIYWTLTTSTKIAPDVMQGHMVPWGDFSPDWKGWRSLGLSPDTINGTSTVREEFFKRFLNSVIASVGASGLAIALGTLAAYGLSRFQYKFLYMRNADISFFFLSQLILPPVVLALPFLVLYKAVALLDNTIGLILLYTLSVLPIVIWIMRDQFDTIPTELDEAGFVDGLSSWGVFLRIIVPI